MVKFHLLFFTIACSALLITGINVSADDSLSSGLVLDFSAKMNSKISPKENSLFMRKNGRGVEERFLTLQLSCDANLTNCLLGIFSISGDYCNGKGKPNSLFTRGYGADFIESVNISRIGKNKLVVKYTDNSLYGSTDNTFVITYKYVLGYGHYMTSLKGNATATKTTIGTVATATYTHLTKPVICSAAFFPPGMDDPPEIEKYKIQKSR